MKHLYHKAAKHMF